MGGEYKKGTGIVFLNKNVIDPYSQTVLETMFDQHTDMEIDEMLHMQNETKAFKRLALVKLLLFPLEYPLTLLIAGLQDATMKYLMIKTSIKLLRGRIDIIQFQHELSQLSVGFAA